MDWRPFPGDVPRDGRRVLLWFPPSPLDREGSYGVARFGATLPEFVVPPSHWAPLEPPG